MTKIEQLVNDLTGKYGKERKSLMPILQGIVKEKRYVDNTDMVHIARALDISAADVYGVASFYSFIENNEMGKYVIRICKSITCEMKGKHKILKALEEELRIKLGETTHNKRFTLLETNCLGLCDVGPAMLINEEPYTKLTPEKVHEILVDYRNEVK